MADFTTFFKVLMLVLALRVAAGADDDSYDGSEGAIVQEGNVIDKRPRNRFIGKRDGGDGERVRFIGKRDDDDAGLDDDKRLRFIGKRVATDESDMGAVDVDKRGWNFKRNNWDAALYNLYAKRRLFIGKRDGSDEEMAKRTPLDQELYRLYQGRRLFIGKRDGDGADEAFFPDASDDEGDDQFYKRRLFIGKRGPTQRLFIG